MKKFAVIICFVAAVGITNKAAAQAQLALGIKGGLNFAKVNESGLDNKTGIHAGAFLLVKASKIGIQPEIIFSRQGFTEPDPLGKFKTEIDYINIPIILKMYLAAGINLQVGPQFGFVSSAKQEIPSVGGKTDMDIKEFVKGTDLSLGLGLGWDLPFGLTIDGRYNLGLSKVNDDNGGDDIKNQVIQISVGYKLFKFGK
jgi:hypothetical protein